MIERIDIHNTYPKYNSASRFLLPSLLLNPKLTDWNVLKKLGFIGIFLYDETERQKLFYKDSLLIILNPSSSFFNEEWELFEQTLRNYPNFITMIDYSGLVFGVWFKIREQFLPNLRFWFKAGKFSMFPKSLIVYLNDTEKRICSLDESYKMGLSLKLGVDIEDLEELASIPEKESYTFKFKKNE